MKINMPVTQREIPYPKGMYVVSQTDLKGVIRDANEAFVALSGFTREELMGKSHNIVRHPDVPPAIFADMWANLKAGMPWQAVVKNRCKNGDHYWVDAQVVPIIRNGEVSGYMSVRREASRQQIKEAEALFAEVKRTGKFNSIKRNPLGLATWIYGICAFSISMFVLNNIVMWLDMPEWVDRLTGILGMAALIPLPFVLYAKVFAPLAEIRKNILSLTEGDLASRYPIRMPNELGQIANSFQIMQTQWLVSIDHIKDSIRDTLQGMQHVAEESDSINRQIESQHDRVSTVAAATEEFCQAVAEVASSAADTSRAAENSGGLIQKTVKAGMQAAEVVVGAVSKSHTSIAELDQAVGKIGDITKVIKEIAEQTNLLALNAAIEAARAGETGRGFAVVADEVRKLAERTAGSTQEINSMVSGIQALAGEVVASMSQAADAVQSSSGKMRESVEGLNRVTEASQLTVDMAEHIANASDQQSIAGQEVARNMEQISQLSEQNQEKLRSLKLSLEEMRVATAKIDEAVGVFKLFSR